MLSNEVQDRVKVNPMHLVRATYRTIEREPFDRAATSVVA